MTLFFDNRYRSVTQEMQSMSVVDAAISNMTVQRILFVGDGSLSAVNLSVSVNEGGCLRTQFLADMSTNATLTVVLPTRPPCEGVVVSVATPFNTTVVFTLENGGSPANPLGVATTTQTSLLARGGQWIYY